MPNTFSTLLLGLQSIQIKVRTAQLQWLRGGAGIDVLSSILRSQWGEDGKECILVPMYCLLPVLSDLLRGAQWKGERVETVFQNADMGLKPGKMEWWWFCVPCFTTFPRTSEAFQAFVQFPRSPVFHVYSPAHEYVYVYIAGRTLASLSLTDIKKKIYVTYKKTTLQQEAVLFYEHPSSGNIKIVQFRQLIFPLETLECNIPGPLSLSFSLFCFHCTSLSCMKLPLRAQAAW